MIVNIMFVFNHLLILWCNAICCEEFIDGSKQSVHLWLGQHNPAFADPFEKLQLDYCEESLA